MHRISTHVGDQAGFFATAKDNAFVQLLSHCHGLPCQKTQARRGFLLQGARDERRARAYAFCVAVNPVNLIKSLL